MNEESAHGKFSIPYNVKIPVNIYILAKNRVGVSQSKLTGGSGGINELDGIHGGCIISLHIRTPGQLLPNCPKMLSFHWGWGYSRPTFAKLSSPKMLSSHYFRGRVLWTNFFQAVLKCQGLSGEFGHKFNACAEACLCFTDSLSHTTYVDTIE